jgi:hypothetical protein
MSLTLLHSDSNKAEPVSLCCTNKFQPFSEKYLKKLIGKIDMEDAEETRQADTGGGSNG